MSDNELKMRLAYDRGRTGEALEAKHGHFSEGFFRSTNAAIKLAPGVVKHVVSLLTANGGTEDRVDGTREAPLPMSVQAFADVNEIYSLLVYWTRVFAAELHVQAPGPAVRAWRNMRGTIVGLPANVTPDGARYLVGIMTVWLDAHLEQICALDPEDVTGFRDGLKYVFQANARWPQEEKARYSDMPCPDDKCKGKIAVFPPKEFGDDETIVCQSCGRHFLPAQYEHLIGVFKQIQAERVTGAKVTAHLAGKYAS